MIIDTNNKDLIREISMKLTEKEISELINNLESKDDKLRYSAFLLLQDRSDFFDDCYKYFKLFIEKLKSDNSYQRSLGLMLIGNNVKWDKDNLFETVFDEYMKHINDDKFITSRQCIQSLKNIVPYKPKLNDKIKKYLENIDYSKFKDTQKSLIERDANEIIKLING